VNPTGNPSEQTMGPWTPWPHRCLADTHPTDAGVVLKEGVSVNVPLIVGGNVRWLSIPTKLPLPPVTGFAFTEARVPSEFHWTSPPVKEPYNSRHGPTRDYCPPTMVFTTSGPGRGGV
jgi:hypothetical protein